MPVIHVERNEALPLHGRVQSQRGYLSSRRRRLLTRMFPLGLLAALAFAVGIIEATGPARDERALARHYVSAWTHGDYTGMYALLDDVSRRTLTESQFVAAYRRAATTATLTQLIAGRITGPDGNFIRVRMRARTRIFGELRQTLELQFSGSGSGSRVHF